jgi:hypothetical protein
MLMAILIICLTLWMTQAYTGIPASLVTFLALVLVLLAGILEWEDVLRNAKAVSGHRAGNCCTLY